MSKEYITMIIKTTLSHMSLTCLFFIDLNKIMQFIAKTFHPPKLVSFFAKFIPKEILTLPEKLLCHVDFVSAVI